MVAKVALYGAVLSVLMANVASAQSVPVVEAGASREAVMVQDGLVQSQGQMVLLLNQIDTLQQEVMELRGLVEQHTNAMEQIQKEGRDRYLDLDRRISQLSAQAKTPARTVANDPAKTSTRPAASAAKKGSTGESIYQDAFQAVRDRRFGEAVDGLTTYLQKYPKGSYAANAQYWLGEIYLLQDSLNKAEVSFSHVIAQFPKSDKRADALYKLGQVNDRMGNTAKAKTYLQRVIKEYPSSSSARLADVYLGNIES